MRTIACLWFVLILLAAWFLIGYGWAKERTDTWYATHEVVIDGANGSFQNYPDADSPTYEFWQRVEKE